MQVSHSRCVDLVLGRPAVRRGEGGSGGSATNRWLEGWDANTTGEGSVAAPESDAGCLSWELHGWPCLWLLV